jgi:hypothetical protein
MRNGAVKRRPCSGAIPAMALIFATFSVLPALCQDKGTIPPAESEAKTETALSKNIFDYLNVANHGRQLKFQPLTQKERTKIFAKSFINPIWYVKGAVSAGANQWADVPEEWEQGASGYGKRFADIMGQYAVRRTVMYGFESLLHEDNRYFISKEKGFWPRFGYSLSSGILARHDNGKRYPSASLLVGYASGAYVSRFWQPASANSVGDAAVSFGISMGWNIGLGVVKEFLPDLLRRK